MVLGLLDVVAIVGAFVIAFFLFVISINIMDYIRELQGREKREREAKLVADRREEIKARLSSLVFSMNALRDELSKSRKDQTFRSEQAFLECQDCNVNEIAKGYVGESSYDLDDAENSIGEIEQILKRLASRVNQQDSGNKPLSEDDFNNVDIEIEFTRKIDADVFGIDTVLTKYEFKVITETNALISYTAMSRAIDEWHSCALLSDFKHDGESYVGTIKFLFDDNLPRDIDTVSLKVSPF
ncbi:hypothetical protein ACXHQ0_19305 [Vibrio antiquarius]|uniref:Uncharacterized protein n=1 Tax=Vibrio parahaemolyticus TaxID=670 RepID=A0AA46ZA76_VIBPH|nr:MULTISPECIES: hypothetical protein [Vibrio harveyi group]KOE92733.1 hypothetical protein ACS91_01790 [Vibrio parahaemolyticus]MCS0313526.1 hypothetical protein [Vibrio diabolicus]UYV30385.1 hypothetical protein M5598_25595 [Vibrio parahaemolyticus]UYW19605.1 hypothetical protein IF561_25060 [Vibrio parahaemolyticus]